jgi:hypothetical protein
MFAWDLGISLYRETSMDHQMQKGIYKDMAKTLEFQWKKIIP